MSEAPKKFSGTKWNVIPNSEMVIITHTPDIMVSWEAMCNNKTFLAPSFCMVSDEIRNKNNFKYFLLDNTDMNAMKLKTEGCKTQAEKEQVFVDFTQSLTSCAKQKFKHVRIRSMAPSKIWSGESDRVFAEDVLEIIPILLEQQNTPIDASDERLEKYRNQWKSFKKHMHNTIDMAELETVLEEFDVNKELLTIVPDPILELFRREFLQQGSEPLQVFTPNTMIAMDQSQAISFTFHTLVCGNTWEKDTCKMHNNCNQNLKKRLLALFNEYANMNKGTYVTNQYILGKIEELKNQCILKYKTTTDCPDYLLTKKNYSSNFDLYHYHATSQWYDIPKYNYFLPRTEATKKEIPVWMMRLFFKFGWIESFFDENDGLRHLVANSLIFLVPLKMKKLAWKWMKSILDKTDFNLPESPPSLLSNPPPQYSQHEKLEEPSVKIETENLNYKKKLEATAKRNEILKQRKEAKKNKGAKDSSMQVPKKVEKKFEATSPEQKKKENVKSEVSKNETKSQSEEQNSEKTANGSVEETKDTVVSNTIHAPEESKNPKCALEQKEKECSSEKEMKNSKEMKNVSKTWAQLSVLESELALDDSETVEKNTVESDPLHEAPIEVLQKLMTELHQKANEGISKNEEFGSESALRTMESLEEVKKNFISEFVKNELTKKEDNGNNDLKELLKSNEQVKKFAKDVGELMAISVSTVSSSKQENDDSNTISNSDDLKIVEEATSENQSAENLGTPQTSKNRVKVVYKLCDTCNMEELREEESYKTTSTTSMDLQTQISELTLEQLNTILPSEPKKKNDGLKTLSSSEKLETILTRCNAKTKNNVPQASKDPQKLYQNFSTTTSENDQNSIDTSLSSTPAADDVASESCKELLCQETEEELGSEQIILKALKLEENLKEIRKKWKEQAVEIVQLKKANSEQVDENSCLKEQILSKDATDKMLRRDNKMLIETRDQLTEKITQLEAQLKSMEPKSSTTTQLRKELQENDRIIAELKEANLRSSIRNEELIRLNKELLDRWTLFHSDETH